MIEQTSLSIDQIIDQSFASASDWANSVVLYALKFNLPNADGLPQEVKIPLLILWLGFAGIFFTFYFRFINFSLFRHAWQTVFGRHDIKGQGQISSFQALTACLSGTVGLGNIAGVAVAVTIGGPGAVFWMIVMGFLGMATKFAEVTLGIKHRRYRDPSRPEEVSGGPMYYLEDAFQRLNKPRLGKFMGILFAVCCLAGALGGGNMFQANQTFAQFVVVTGGETSFWADKGWLFGVILAVLTGLVILGGIKSIARTAEKIVPLMAGIYLLLGLVVIVTHIDQLIPAIVTIVKLAFVPEAGLAGLVGAMVAGIQRASFSNEAGLGTAPIVHAPVQTNNPVAQGLVGMLGPFLDTVVICAMTGIMIVITGVYLNGDGLTGVQLTSQALSSAVSWFPYVLFGAVFLFCYSTLITYCYYGEKVMTYLFGEKKWVAFIFHVIFLIFIVIGSSTSLSKVIDLADAMILSMAIPNLIGVYILAPEIKQDLLSYIRDIKSKELAIQAKKQAEKS
jgi:alanine or glycine:cation symporter, AGCS family